MAAVNYVNPSETCIELPNCLNPANWEWYNGKTKINYYDITDTMDNIVGIIGVDITTPLTNYENISMYTVKSDKFYNNMENFPVYKIMAEYKKAINQILCQKFSLYPSLGYKNLITQLASNEIMSIYTIGNNYDFLSENKYDYIIERISKGIMNINLFSFLHENNIEFDTIVNCGINVPEEIAIFNYLKNGVEKEYTTTLMSFQDYLKKFYLSFRHPVKMI